MNQHVTTHPVEKAQPLTRSMVVLSIILLLMPLQAFAYVDPGTGTMLWQMLLGLVVGAGFYSRRIFGWLTRKRR